ncbi:MAG: GspE/PulE family protein [Cyanobacteriota bacterium]|nr:GspE/PulE family protein [Cyanobacteriota bacterium]
MDSASTTSSATISAWRQLKNREITPEEALDLLVDGEGRLRLDLLDQGLVARFFQEFPDASLLPPVIPLLLWRASYYLACARELTADELKFLAERTHTAIRIVPIDPQSYRSWFRLQNMPGHEAIHATGQYLNPLTGVVEEQNIGDVADYLAQAASQSHRINALISGALQSRASDIHLEPTLNGLRVRYRIDGILREIAVLPQEISRSVVVAIKVMSDMNIAESRAPQDGRIGRNYVSGQDVLMDLDLRVSTLPCVGGEKVVIRLLHRQENAFSDLSTLGFTANTLRLYQTWLEQPQGLIIITGPTGSGKTSTLYTSLHKVATEFVNVVTVEDPVEYVLTNITQTQVHERAGMTFASGLRSILRQDPDIIMVGEIRDQETAETVIRAALTGHLVLTTMHTNDTITAIPRLKDLGPDPGLLSDALLGITAQRLVRRVCPYCAEPYTPSDQDWQLLGLETAATQPGNWRKGRGCSKCFQSGYLGREAIVELLNVDETVRQIIYEGSITQLQRYLDQIQFDSFRVSAIGKVVTGITTLEEVRRVLPQSALIRRSSDRTGVLPAWRVS